MGFFNTFFSLTLIIVIVFLSFDSKVSGFEIITPTDLRSSMPRAPGIPPTTVLRPYDEAIFTEAALPEFNNGVKVREAILAVKKDNLSFFRWVVDTFAEASGDSSASAYSKSYGSIPAAQVPTQIQSLISCDVEFVDRDGVITATNDGFANDKVLFFVGDGLGGGVNKSCTVRDREIIAQNAGAHAMVIIDLRDRRIPTKVHSASSLDDGLGVMPVWGISRAPGLAIASRILAGEYVSLKMYQNPPSAQAMYNLGSFHARAKGFLWSYPSTYIATIVENLVNPKLVADAMRRGEHVLLCALGILITCSPDGEVAGLLLSGYVINAALPEELDVFPNLEIIQASISSISAPLPDILGKLSSLREIDITSNPELLGSPIPNVSNLKSLWLLRISGAGLTGDIPDFSAMTSVREIDIGSNSLNGSLPQLGAWSSQLKLLTLSANALTGRMADMGSFSMAPTLESLDISDNEIEGPVPDDIGLASALEYIDISSNRIEGTLPSSLGSLDRLRGLEASFNDITSPIPDTLASMSSLELLSLKMCKLTGTVPARLPASIRKLDLTGNDYTSSPEKDTWTDLLYLSEVLLAENRINVNVTRLETVFPASTFPTRGISIIDLSDNRIVSESTYPNIKLDLSNYRSLKELRLAGNELRGQFWIVSRADKTPAASVLDISRNPGIGGGLQSSIMSMSFSVINITGTSIVHNVYADGIVASPAGQSKVAGEQLGGEDLDSDALLALAKDAASSIPSEAFLFAEYLYNSSANVHSPSLPRDLDNTVGNPAGSNNASSNATESKFNIDVTSVNFTQVNISLSDPTLQSVGAAGGDGSGRPSRRLQQLGSYQFGRLSALQDGEGEDSNTTDTTTTSTNTTDDDRQSNMEAQQALKLYELLAEGLPPSVRIDHSVRFIAPERNMWCPSLRGVGNGTSLTIVADPLVHNYAYCVCIAGYTRVSGNRCHKCPDHVSCPGLEDQLDMIVETGYYPTPDFFEPLAVVSCPISVLSASPCNPDGLGAFTCAEGYTDRLCSVCEEGYFRRNGLCFECSKTGVFFVIIAFGFLFTVFFMFAIRVFAVRKRNISARVAIAGESKMGPGDHNDVGDIEAGDAWNESSASTGGGGGDDNSSGERSATGTPVSNSALINGLPAPSRYLNFFYNLGKMRSMTLLSIFLFYSQTLSLSMDGFDLPTELGIIKEIYDVTNLSVTSLGAGCVVGRLNFREGYLLSWLSPIGMIVIIWIATVFLIVAFRLFHHMREVRDVAAAMTLIVISVTFFPMSKESLSKFRYSTDPVTGIQFFAEAPSIEFDEIPLLEKVIPALIYPFGGFMVILLIGLFANSRMNRALLAKCNEASKVPSSSWSPKSPRKKEGSQAVEWITFCPTFAKWVFEGFHSKYWYIAILLFSRRLIVASVVALVPEDNAIRYAIVAIVIIVSAASTMYLLPYKLSAANGLEAFSLVTASMIYVCSFIAANDSFRSTAVLIVFIFALHILAMAIFLSATAAIVWRKLKISNRSRNRRSYEVERVLKQEKMELGRPRRDSQ